MSTDLSQASPQQRSAPAWAHAFVEDFKAVFVTQWSPFLGVALLVLVNLALIASGNFWGVFAGVRLWGDYFNNFIGLGPLLGIAPTLEDPLMHRISVMNIALLLGAFAAALLASQFRINHAPKLEYVYGALGGTLMGVGALFAGGCTTGGFFTPLLFSSPAGWVMLLGLLAGAAVGLKVLLWSMEHITWGTAAPHSGEPFARPFYPWFGAAVLGLVGWWAGRWLLSGDERLAERGLLILGGLAIGFILTRSRFCLSRVVREPLMTGEGELTKAFIVAIAIGAPVAALVLAHSDPYLAIPPRFWLGSLIGGAVFGVGMIFAGGCASGSLWRMGEGHLKLWVALFFFAWSGSTFGALIGRTGIFAAEMNLDLVEETALGMEAWWPALLDGWGMTWLVTFALLGLWYALVAYNESSSRFTVT
jgi:uncharacterized protein